MRTAVNGFVSYAEADLRLVEQFLALMQPRLAILKDYAVDTWWARNRILTGHNWREEIDRAMAASDFGLFLESPSFFASEFITLEEIRHFLNRSDSMIFNVGLVPVDRDLADRQGLTPHQVHRLRIEGQQRRRCFSECGGANRDRFCDQLVADMVARFEARGARSD